MSLSAKAERLLKQAFAGIDGAAVASELAGATLGTKQTKVTPVAITYTASADSRTNTGALTIANGGTPTVVELLHYCNELRQHIVQLQAILTAQGITT